MQLNFCTFLYPMCDVVVATTLIMATLPVSSSKFEYDRPSPVQKRCLSIQQLTFGRKQFTKGPDVIRQACRHCWRALPLSGTKCAVTFALVQRQLLP